MKQKRLVAEPATKKAYSIPELSRLYPVSVGFLRGEIRRGALKAARLGRRRMVILSEDWEAFLRRAQQA